MTEPPPLHLHIYFFPPTPTHKVRVDFENHGATAGYVTTLFEIQSAHVRPYKLRARE